MGSVACNQPRTKNKDIKIAADQSTMASEDIRTITFTLNKLLQKGRYFKFESYYSTCRNLLPEKYKTYFDIFQCDLFGYPELLEKRDRILLKKYYDELTESEKISYHLIKISHYQKKYEYKNAYTEVLKMRPFAEYLDSFIIADLRQYHAKFLALQHVPPMSVRKHINDSVQLEKVWAHMYIPVSINGNMVNLIFDTGSEKSLISNSLAEKFGLKVIDTETEITGTTGARAATNLGIAEKVFIGNTVYEHVVFEVIEDSLLGVPEYDFYFDGLVGFNLLYPLGSIALNADGLLKINASSGHDQLNNLAIRHFSNRVSISFRDKTIPVKFDTGAYMSIFNKHFYELYRTVLCETGTPKSFEYGGIGGGRTVFNMILLDTMACAVYNDSVFLKNTRIHSKYIHADTVTYYGLLGMDFVDQFHEITMNFNPHSIQYKIRN
jgi:predicted aspartyl protease